MSWILWGLGILLFIGWVHNTVKAATREALREVAQEKAGGTRRCPHCDEAFPLDDYDGDEELECPACGGVQDAKGLPVD